MEETLKTADVCGTHWITRMKKVGSMVYYKYNGIIHEQFVACDEGYAEAMAKNNGYIPKDAEVVDILPACREVMTGEKVQKSIR